MVGWKVLYIDDEPGLLDLAKAFLEQEDFQIDTEGDPRASLQRLAPGTYDVVVSDYQMPDLDGIELLKALRERGDRIPFILFTGKGREEVAIEALNNGADFYIQKGGDPAALFKELKNAIIQLSHRRSMEERLRESERRMITLMNNLPGMAYRCRNDPNWTMEFVSDGCLSLTGYPASDLLYNKRIAYASLIVPEDQKGVWDEVQAGIREGRPYRKVYSIRTASGELKWVLEQGEGIVSPDGEVLSLEGFIADITEHKMAEEALLRANNKLNLLSSTTRHDIRNQLMIISSYIQLLKRDIDDPAKRGIIANVERSARKVEMYIEFTKDYEEMGSLEPRWQNVADIVRSLPTSKEVGGLCLTDRLAGLEVFADPMLPKVFHNLFEDSVRYGGRPVTVTIDCAPTDRGMLIIYGDDGVGVAESEKARIFGKGYGKGTGLGLFLSREILGITGITIVENGRPGEGARFEIMVPSGTFRPNGGRPGQP